MSVLDALTILGSGIGQGYRGSQEVQRQIAEAKRKALLEERDQIVREQAAASANALATAQATNLGSETSARDFSTGEARAASLRGSAPIMPHGSPRLSIGGNNFNLPNRLDILQNPEVSRLLGQSSEEQFKANHPDYYMHYPPVGGNSASFNNTPEGKALKYMQLVFGTNIPALMGEDEDSYSARVTKERQQRLNFLLNNKDTIDDLLGGTGSGSDSLGTDKPKPKPKGSSNRFKVKVN